ncbi:hypothetical protein [Simiduia sp. 21SJ11W-1]|nr:hypothetical protein [Simiduia sp. 21SJ11W-1]
MTNQQTPEQIKAQIADRKASIQEKAKRIEQALKKSKPGSKSS